MVSPKEIEEALSLIRPQLQADGGDVAFVSFSDGIVSVRLQGACGSCPMALMTLKMSIEAQLQESYPEIKEVVAIQ
ncbi:MAG: NifU family protein [Treponema sp.]